jgi:amino acid adenylation domain-containing protein
LDTGIQNEAEGGFRLAPQQRRLWLLRSLDGPGAHSTQHVFHVEGDLDPDALAAALRVVTERYEILRTAFRCVPGINVPLQVVGGALPPALEVRDLRNAGPEEVEAALHELLQGADSSSFDPEAGPLLRMWMPRLPGGRSMLVVRACALCLDRVGLDRILQEVANACLGIEPDEEPLQYADLAEWQNGLLESAEGATEREAWRQRDLSALAVRLPFESRVARPRPFRPTAFIQEVDQAVAATVEGLAARSGCAVDSLLLTIWGGLLARLSGSSDLVIGTVFSGRTYEGLEAVPGLLARVLPLRFRNEESWSLPRLVRQVSQELSEARDSQEYFSWEDLDIPIEAEAGLPGTGFAPFGFEFLGPELEITVGTARLVPLLDVSCTDRFTVCLVARWGADRHRLEIRYDSDALQAEDIVRLAAQLEALLRQLITLRGDGTAGELDVLSAEERRQLLAEVDETRLTLPAAGGMHRLFEEQAARTPERTALVWEDSTLSYGELNAQANRLAHRLRDLGTGPDDRIALCLERSHEMVVALLAVLKAGGAYLPLDPLLPPQRLQLFLEESGARFLISEMRFLDLFPDLAVPALCPDRDREDLALQSAENPSGGALSENLAYVLFTSGSTGVPKGVAVEHRQLVNYLVGAADRLGLSAGGSFATVSTFAADLGNTMIFPALCSGGCLHVVASDRVSDPERFAEYAESRGIDCLKIVPSHLQALLAGSNPARALPRRKLVLGGEALGWDLVARVRELRPECEVFNHYGPTETTVGMLAGRVPGERRWDLAATVPLGRPLANSQVYLLDAALRPVPTWVPGELYVGGAGLARGYLGRPDLTADRFVPHPIGAPGERLYRTGDLARWQPDGTVEFLGRIDGQVKIRGFRIEVGEIEALLRQHPRVREAVALARRDDGSEPRLVAYVIPEPQQPPEPMELRDFLVQRLPEAMVPSVFVFLKALPLNSNGKVDRGALPALDAARPMLRNPFEAPATETERIMTEIWQTLLGVETVGATDDFFELGGHSLLCVQLISRLREIYQVEIPMRRVFEESTVRRLSQVVEEVIHEEIGQLSDEQAELLLGGAA